MLYSCDNTSSMCRSKLSRSTSARPRSCVCWGAIPNAVSVSLSALLSILVENQYSFPNTPMPTCQMAGIGFRSRADIMGVYLPPMS